MQQELMELGKVLLYASNPMISLCRLWKDVTANSIQCVQVPVE